jgi:membrane fusion protein, multidrug efflux system
MGASGMRTDFEEKAGLDLGPRHATWAVAGLLVLLAGCGRRPETKIGSSHPPSPARSVSTAAAVRAGDGGEITLPAVVQARQRATLSARIPASVVELPFREGEAVKEGAVVARLDDGALRAAVSAAEAALRSAEADLARAQGLLEKGAATPRELEEATARAAGARAQLSGAKDNLAYAVLRSPFAGRLAARPANVGDVVSPGVTLVEIEGEGGLELKATVEAEVAGRLRPGAKIRALADGQAEPLAAIVRSVAPAGDPTTHRFEVRADLAGTPGLRAGVFARLVLPAPGGPARITVPGSALFERGGLTGVFVVVEGKARLRWVAPGAPVGDALEIRAGIEAGERVALDPAGLTDGAPVVER